MKNLKKNNLKVLSASVFAISASALAVPAPKLEPIKAKPEVPKAVEPVKAPKLPVGVEAPKGVTPRESSSTSTRIQGDSLTSGISHEAGTTTLPKDASHIVEVSKAQRGEALDYLKTLKVSDADAKAFLDNAYKSDSFPSAESWSSFTAYMDNLAANHPDTFKKVISQGKADADFADAVLVSISNGGDPARLALDVRNFDAESFPAVVKLDAQLRTQVLSTGINEQISLLKRTQMDITQQMKKLEADGKKDTQYYRDLTKMLSDFRKTEDNLRTVKIDQTTGKPIEAHQAKYDAELSELAQAALYNDPKYKGRITQEEMASWAANCRF